MERTGPADIAATQTVFDHARAVADAVLYEGYLLYPYRKSSSKNQVRWQFGVLASRRWIDARGPVVDGVAGSTESWWQQTECLVEAPDSAAVHIRPRYLQLQVKSVDKRCPGGTFQPVERLELGDRAEVAFDEAVPHETDVVVTVAELLAGERRVDFGVPGGADAVPAYDDQGREAGRVVRRRWPVRATLRLSVEPAQTPFRLHRLRVRIENADTATPPEAPRPEALRHALIAAHSVLALSTGSFVSLLDPPAWATPAAKACANVRTFPVLAGESGGRDLVLSAPIILYDHPQIAPESPGDLHDATEIDEILSLRTLTLTEEEKREARATDPRAAAIVDRVDSMPPEIMERLHGAVRSLRPARAAPVDDALSPTAPTTPWWDPGADASVSPDTDHVVVDGVRVARGSRVRLRPRRRGTDAHDMFLAGRTARVEAVFLDVDDVQHVAVTIEDDPSADVHQWYRRFHYFAPEEVEPLPADEGAVP
ncbi:MAG TPA: hypothetical protein VFJ14_11145 [Nocardioidaceae bacterium]|nr:hypothetical protein [Nocardioidaceae bacterium]